MKNIYMKRAHRKDFYKMLGKEWDLCFSQTGLDRNLLGKLYGFFVFSYSDKIIVFESDGQLIGCAGYGGFHKKTIKRLFWKFKFNYLLNSLDSKNKKVLKKFYLEEAKAYKTERSLNTSKSPAELTILIVNKDYRGQHIGSTLYSFSKAGARRDGFDVLSIYTTIDECNFEFYEHDKQTIFLKKEGVQYFYSVPLKF